MHLQVAICRDITLTDSTMPVRVVSVFKNTPSLLSRKISLILFGQNIETKRHRLSGILRGYWGSANLATSSFLQKIWIKQ